MKTWKIEKKNYKIIIYINKKTHLNNSKKMTKMNKNKFRITIFSNKSNKKMFKHKENLSF